MLKRFADAQPSRHMAAASDSWPDLLESDPRWCLAQRIVADQPFARSPLLSRFLLYVVAETLMGRQIAITEHQIGVQVFGRSPGYRTDEDNIVRNYARQLRKRLAEHFSGDSRNSPMRIEIPVGGYVPVFITAPESRMDERIDLKFDLKIEEKPLPASQSLLESSHRPSFARVLSEKHTLRGRFWIAVYSVILISFTWLAASLILTPHPPPEPAKMLWRNLLIGSSNTYIVPSDAGLNLLEDMSHHALPLADYIKGSYLELPLSSLDNQTSQDVRTQQFTDFISMQIVAALALQQEYDASHVHLRFPRDLRLDDLKTSNAIIIGSSNSNPWAAMADSGANFRIVPNVEMRGALIVNAKPQPGEAASYGSHWNEPAHETYALIKFVPNLSGNGNMLLLEGLDVAGTQSAAEFLFHSNAIAPILKQASRPDESLRPFEILLRSTSIQSNAAGSQVVAIRIH